MVDLSELRHSKCILEDLCVCVCVCERERDIVTLNPNTGGGKVKPDHTTVTSMYRWVKVTRVTR